MPEENSQLYLSKRSWLAGSVRGWCVTAKKSREKSGGRYREWMYFFGPPFRDWGSRRGVADPRTCARSRMERIARGRMFTGDRLRRFSVTRAAQSGLCNRLIP